MSTRITTRRCDAIDRPSGLRWRFDVEPRRAGRLDRRGFTLMELMLVLAVLVVMVAMVAPAMHRPLQNYKLRKGAEHIRTLIGKAQLRAMRSGQIQMLLVLPGTGQVQVQTYSTDQDILEATPQYLAQNSGMGGQAANPYAANPYAANTTLPPLVDSLPEGVVFTGAQMADDFRDQYTQQQQTSMVGGVNQDLLVQGATPVMFYPDGTSSTTRLILTNGLDAYVVIDLRGLTGVAQLSDLLTAIELGGL